MKTYKQTEKGAAEQTIFDVLVECGLAEIVEDKTEASSPAPAFTDGRARSARDVSISIHLRGEIFDLGERWSDDEKERLIAAGNAFITEEAARKELLTRRSRIPSCPVPKVGDSYHVAGSITGPTSFDSYIWQNDGVDVLLYTTGRVFTFSPEGEKLARQWITDFGSTLSVTN